MGYVAKGFMRNVGNSIILQEIMFAIIMTMIIIVLARIGLLFHDETYLNEEFARAIVCMNVTWGAIDAIVVYYISTVSRDLNRENIKKIRKIPEEEAVEQLMGTFEGTYLENLREDDRREICRKIYNSKTESEDVILEHERYSRRERILISLMCFIVTASISIPCLLSMYLVPDFGRAMALTGLIYTIILFLVGYYLGKEIGRNGYIVGIILAVLTMSIAVVSALTGG